MESTAQFTIFLHPYDTSDLTFADAHLVMKAKQMVLGIVCGSLILAGDAKAGGIECAIDAVLEMSSKEETWLPQGVPITLGTNEFTLHRVEMTEKKGGQHTLVGKLARKNGNAKEDEISYRIIKVKGAITDVQIGVNGRDWQPMSAEMMEALGDLRTTGGADAATRKSIYSALDRASTLSWITRAELLIAHIGIRHC